MKIFGVRNDEVRTLTLKTTGMYISAGQSMLANTVTVKYQNK